VRDFFFLIFSVWLRHAEQEGSEEQQGRSEETGEEG
jgi:hypothetical protein